MVRVSPVRQRKPGFVEMVDPTEVGIPPAGGEWAFEIKWDGYRAQAHLENGRSTVYTRRGNDWTEQFAPVSRAVAKLKARTVILDGEVVTLDREGRGDFHALRRELGTVTPRIVYKVFDLLWLDGEDLRPQPLSERKHHLRLLLFAGGPILSFVDWMSVVDGADMLKAACNHGLEGIVAKRKQSPYRAGRSHDWLKIKGEMTETFAVVGFHEDDHDRLRGLYLGRAEGDTWRYAGEVERGIGDDDLAELEHRLRSLVTARAPLIQKPKGKSRARWTRPEVLVEVSYPNKTEDGRLRHPRFKGLRDDLTGRPKRERRLFILGPVMK